MRRSCLALLLLCIGQSPVLASGQTHPQDECAQARNLPDLWHQSSENNLCATTSQPAWPCGGNVGSDVWYQVTARCTGTMEFAISSTTFDSALEVFLGDCNSLVSQACQTAAAGTAIRVQRPIQYGEVYHLRVGGVQGAMGTFLLEVHCTPGNVTCAQAFPVMDGMNGPFHSRNPSGPAVPPWPCEQPLNGLTISTGVFFAYTATCTGITSFEACDLSGGDPAIEVFDGPCGNLISQDCAIGGSACRYGARVRTVTTAGTTYYVRVGGQIGQGSHGPGVFSLEVLPCNELPTNDDCQSATNLTFGMNGPFTTVGATPSAPLPACSTPGPDVWFAFFAQCAGTLTLETCGGGSTFDTALEVFTGTCSNLTPVACNDDACGTDSRLSFQVAASTPLWIRLSAPAGPGNTRIQLSMGPEGSIQTRPTGCGPVEVRATGRPAIGEFLSFELLGRSGQGLAFGLPQNLPLCPPATCTLGLSPLAIVFPQLGPTGTHFFARIPCDHSLLGQVVSAQAFQQGSQGCPAPLSLEVSDTVDITIGR